MNAIFYAQAPPTAEIRPVMLTQCWKDKCQHQKYDQLWSRRPQFLESSQYLEDVEEVLTIMNRRTVLCKWRWRIIIFSITVEWKYKNMLSTIIYTLMLSCQKQIERNDYLLIHYSLYDRKRFWLSRLSPWFCCS